MDTVVPSISSLDKTGWLKHIKSILDGVLMIVEVPFA
jgi:hypothetical protein